MHDWLKRNERDNSDCGLGSPVAHLARNRLLGENVLAIHVNCLARGDATLLAKTKPTSSIARAATIISSIRRFERERLANAGVNLCLGTDSLATVRKTGKQKPELDMFAEMRALADQDVHFTGRNFADGHRQRRPRPRPGRENRRVSPPGSTKPSSPMSVMSPPASLKAVGPSRRNSALTEKM
jgi:hypothetical protein